jgi:hypothetical protein
MHKLPRKGTKDLLKLDAMRRPGPPPGANKRELQNTDPCGYKFGGSLSTCPVKVMPPDLRAMIDAALERKRRQASCN